MFLHLVLMGVGTWLVWHAGGMLERTAEKIARARRWPPLVEGNVITAVGSSVPELSTAVLATALHGEFELGVASIIGSAIFNLVVIPGLSSVTAGSLRADPALARRELPFYLVSVLGLAGVFVAAWALHPVNGGAQAGRITRELVLLPLALYGVYLWMQWKGTRRHQRESATTGASGTITRRDVVRLTASLVLIVVGVEGLVRGAIFLGDWFGTPSYLWGATVVAAATSAPDAVVSLRQAHGGRGSASLGNVVGSNVFDLLVAVPAGILVAGSAVVRLGVALPMMVALVVLSLLVVVLVRNGRALSRADGGLLIASWIVFVAWVALDAT